MDVIRKSTEQGGAETAKTMVQLVTRILATVGKGVANIARADAACRDYYNSYLERHGQIRILGMSKPTSLENLYTEVRLLEPRHLQAFQSTEALKQQYLQRGRRSFEIHDETRCPPRPGLDVANEPGNRFLNIIGAPGSGKSTFLAYLGLAALQGYRRSTAGRLSRDADKLPYAFNLLPVLLRLRDLRRRADTDIEAWVDDEMAVNGFPEGFGRAALKDGHCLLLLDGIDEIPDERATAALGSLRDFADLYSKCRFVVSCRTAFQEYRAAFPKFTDIILAEFSDQQIREFVGNWFSEEKDRDAKVAERLIDLLFSTAHTATLELARSPLLASFICINYDASQGLTANRTELYQDALDIIVRRWAADRRVHAAPVHPGLDGRRQILMLEALAGPAFEQDRYFFLLWRSSPITLSNS